VSAHVGVVTETSTEDVLARLRGRAGSSLPQNGLKSLRTNSLDTFPSAEPVARRGHLAGAFPSIRLVNTTIRITSIYVCFVAQPSA